MCQRSFTGESNHDLGPIPWQSLNTRRYVGNTMAGFVMQSLGCEVAAMNTVQFSTYCTNQISTGS